MSKRRDAWASAFAELRLLARLVEASLLALDLAVVAGQEAGAFERCAQVLVGIAEGAGDAVAHGMDWATAIAARGTAIYTAGARMSKSRGSDLLLIRWNRSGKRVWTRAYDSGDRQMDQAVDVAVDRRGNVTVVGTSPSTAGGDDWVVIGYRPDGTRRYVKRYDGPAHGQDEPYHMVLDSSGRVYAAGFSSSAAGNRDALVVKYSATGRRLWARRYKGLGAGLDAVAESLRLRPGSGVYVAGWRDGGLATGRDGLLLAYSAAGRRLFATIDQSHAPGSTAWQAFHDLEVMPGGRIVCGGYDTATGFGEQQYLASFDPSTGLPDGWRSWGGDAGNDRVFCMAKDDQGGIYASGTWATGTGTWQIFTQRIRIRGTSWQSSWPAAPTGADYPTAIAVKGANAYVVGTHWDPVTHDDQVLVGYVY